MARRREHDSRRRAFYHTPSTANATFLKIRHDAYRLNFKRLPFLDVDAINYTRQLTMCSPARLPGDGWP